MLFNKPCLICGVLTKLGNRCQIHQDEYDIKEANRPKTFRQHYQGDYAKRAKDVRDNAVVCWLCKEGYRANDPWTADHYYPGVPDSPLLPAHRSCNSSRGNRPIY